MALKTLEMPPNSRGALDSRVASLPYIFYFRGGAGGDQCIVLDLDTYHNSILQIKGGFLVGRDLYYNKLLRENISPGTLGVQSS